MPGKLIVMKLHNAEMNSEAVSSTDAVQNGMRQFLRRGGNSTDDVPKLSRAPSKKVFDINFRKPVFNYKNT